MRYFSSKLPDHVKVQMPSLSPTMEKGNIAKWCKKEGDEVNPGDILAEVETDKATVDFEMQEEGFIAKLLVEEGAKDVNLGEIVAILVNSKEDVEAFKDYKPEKGGKAAAQPKKEETRDAKQEKEDKKGQKGKQDEADEAAIDPKDVKSESGKSASRRDTGDRVVASPYARKLAEEKGIDLSEVTGTGPHGRIIAADIEEYTPSKAAKKKGGVAQAPSTGKYTDVEVSQMRKVIAQRLSQSKETIPHYYVSVECEVDKLLALRAKLNTHSSSKISVNDMIIKAASLAALQVPSTNSSWQGEFIREFKNVDMSVAVSTPKGLITPIIKNANVKGLQQIATEMKDLANRARENKLKLDEFQGGTFSISNMGMYGVSHFSAIINPPQACILAVGGAQKRVLPNETVGPNQSEFRVANVLTVTLSSDHRVVDGADAATWGQHFKKYIENPELMLL
jgi:pyruvate dehydrogenase E2 component (dihydrolipoamide acetyltransferase)